MKAILSVIGLALILSTTASAQQTAAKRGIAVTPRTPQKKSCVKVVKTDPTGKKKTADTKPAGVDDRYAYYQLSAGSIMGHYGRYIFRLKYVVSPTGEIDVDLKETQKYINGYNSHYTEKPTAFAGRYTKSKIPEFSATKKGNTAEVVIDWRYFDSEEDPSDPDMGKGSSTISIDKNGSWVSDAGGSWCVSDEANGLIKIPFVSNIGK
ncbi:MAG: hypothetical protein WCQ53_03805 [bacterium]